MLAKGGFMPPSFMPPNYWVISASDKNNGRDYSEIFFKYGMAFVGGNEQEEQMKKVNCGDIFLLKKGMHKIIAAGEKVEKRNSVYCGDARSDNKKWLLDIEGWELPAYCYVEWHKPEEELEVNNLTPRAIYKTVNIAHKDIADKIIKETGRERNEYEAEPDVEPLDDDVLLKELAKEGLRPSAAEDLTIALKRIRLLANYYYTYEEENFSCWEEIKEHETRSFLVIPLLLALGWSEQQLKIELAIKNRQRIDIACFKKPYRRDNKDCVLIIETKSFSSGLDYATPQAKLYAEAFTNCNAVIATNGYCYKAYQKEKDTFSDSPSSYLNLLRPTKNYPLDSKVGGALELLKLLLPQNSR